MMSERIGAKLDGEKASAQPRWREKERVSEQMNEACKVGKRSATASGDGGRSASSSQSKARH